MNSVVAIVLRIIGYDHHADANREQTILQLSSQADDALADTEKTINTARIELYGGAKNSALKHPHKGQQIVGER